MARSPPTPAGCDSTSGPEARLDLALHDVHGWTRRAFGGLGVAHVIPGLSQHWHPHVLGARASGTARIDGETIDLAEFDVYAEKNWGVGGFPDRWWWGQALAFNGADVCVAFAGGDVGLGPLRTTATALVVRLGDTLIRLGDPVLSPARAELDDGRWNLRAPGAAVAGPDHGRGRPGGRAPAPCPDAARTPQRPGRRAALHRGDARRGTPSWPSRVLGHLTAGRVGARGSGSADTDAGRPCRSIRRRRGSRRGRHRRE